VEFQAFGIQVLALWGVNNGKTRRVAPRKGRPWPLPMSGQSAK
jgi:hypothetical protein